MRGGGSLFAHRLGGAPALGSNVVSLEITPEPSEEERAAIVAALSEDALTSQNLSLEDEREP